MMDILRSVYHDLQLEAELLPMILRDRYHALQDSLVIALTHHGVDIILFIFLTLTIVFLKTSRQITNASRFVVLMWCASLLAFAIIPHNAALNVLFYILFVEITSLLAGYPSTATLIAQTTTKDETPTPHPWSSIPEPEFTALPDHVSGAGVTDSDEDETHVLDDNYSESVSKVLDEQAKNVQEEVQLEHEQNHSEDSSSLPVVEVIHLDEEF